MTIETDIQDDAIFTHPEECVGYILDGEYHLLENISKNPKREYKLRLKDKFFLMDLHKKGLLEALVHSHPVLDNNPSQRDMEAHLATGYNFYIIGTDGKTTTEIRRINYEESNS